MSRRSSYVSSYRRGNRRFDSFEVTRDRFNVIRLLAAISRLRPVSANYAQKWNTGLCRRSSC
jgi:hypothetical protein